MLNKSFWGDLNPDDNPFRDLSTPLLAHLDKMFQKVPHPYLKMVISEGSSVEVLSLAANKELEHKVRTHFATKGFQRNGCYYNSYSLMKDFHSTGVKYVEGIVRKPEGRILSHAWISQSGEHFDPTYEFNNLIKFRDTGISSDGKPLGDYLKLIEFSPNDFKKRLNKSGAPWKGRPPIYPPFAANVFSIPHLIEDQYNFNHDTYYNLLVSLSQHYSELYNDPL